MISAGTLYNIMLPRQVVETGAAIRALHAAVTGIEITALAESKAMSLVLTEELAG